MRKEGHVMVSRIISALVLLAFVTYISGCWTIEKVFRGEPLNPEEKIVEVVYPTGDVVKFNLNGGKYIKEKGVIVGVTRAGKRVEIPTDDILYVRVSRVHAGRRGIVVTIGVAAAMSAFAFAIALATKESCPFVYSYDGEQYVFDAEPYGGAITAGLKRTDYSRLEHLKPVDGKYQLMMRNEVEETQYTDEMKLMIVDHAINVEVMPDYFGQMHPVEKPVTPNVAVDENGKDLMKFMKARDNIAWQSSLPTEDSYRGQNLRHQLTFEFPKPPEAKTAKLLVNAGTAFWGSNMIREMLQLRGNRVDAWYDAIDRGGPELIGLYQFNQREELYLLKTYVKEGESWVQHGVISGGGPLINEDRVISLDLTNVPGDTLTIRLNPPMGFWAIDFIGVEYGNTPPLGVREIPIASAEDQHGNDVSDLLSTVDNSYQALPEVGDWVKLSFDMPAQREGSKRSIFLKTSGYYEIHLPKDQPEQTELLQKLAIVPGFSVEFALDLYLKWHAQQQGSN
jgi:hypothetical protein